MNPSVRRKLSDGKTGLSRAKDSKSEEHEGKPGTASVSLPSSPSREEEPGPENSTEASRRAGRSKEAQRGSSSDDDAEKTLFITVDNEQSCPRQSGKTKRGVKRKREMSETGSQQQQQQEDELQPDVEIDQELDRELENKSRQHNLTSANVRSIIHEVITNEHVVAMMKAAINETEPVPLFEPKMTRSKLKEVVEKGVVIPTWNISPIKKPSNLKGPQFVDIPLEEEDSSDEEYHPDEEEEDETAEDTLLESDLESTASSPRGTRLNLNRSYSEYDAENSCSPRQSLRRSQHVRVAVVPMGPPPPPQGPEPPRPQTECSFMEKLHAVDEELAIGSDCMDSYQSLTSNGEEGEESLMAFRTRSKRPLRDVPLGRLEAELRAPDITPDMYEFGSAPEDREWTRWLQGLMNSDVENEEEGDDDDDPEYNFLADIDEPDVEDYRNDKAVRITKKEVNDLMEELFDAFQDELGGQDEEGQEEEEKEEEDTLQQDPPSILETIQYEDPLADILNKRYRTVKEQLDAIRKRKALLESKGVSIPPKCPTGPASLYLSSTQKLRLQQHIQQHVQLLTQVSMLSRSVDGLQTEACTARQFLSELQFFAQQGEQAQQVMDPGFVSIFRACNLQPALSLLEELDQSPKSDTQGPCPVFPGSQIPADLAWLMVTRPVFLYPQLLPVVRARPFSQKGPFTSAENCLVVLGHQHLKGTVNPLKLTCQYLLAARNFICLRVYVRSACHKQRPNFIKRYFLEGKCPPMPLACEKVSPSDQRPPVERETRLMPRWLLENLKLIHEEVRKYNLQLSNPQHANPEENSASKEDSSSPSYSFPPGTRYPPSLPDSLALSLKPRPHPVPASCRKKASRVPSSHTTTQSKPPPSTKDVEKALSRLPPLLPKFANQNVNPDRNVTSVSKKQKIKCRTNSANSAGKTRVAANNVTNSSDQNQGKLIITLPTAPVTSSAETQIKVPSAATIGPNQGNVIMTLPTALICPTPSATLVAQTPSSFTPLVKEHMSQGCGTLLKLSMGQRPNLNPLSVSSQIFLLPPGCVVTNSTNVNPDHSQKSLITAKNVAQETGLEDLEGSLGNLPERMAVSQANRNLTSGSEGNNDQENDEMETKVHEEELECGDEDFREPFLTLSESSGSPAPSLSGEDDAMETVMDREVEDVEEQRQRASQTSIPTRLNEQPCWTEGEKDEREYAGMQKEKSRSMADITSPASVTSEMSLPELQETMEKLSKLASDLEEKRLSREEKSDGCATGEDIADSELLYDDLSDDDPRRDIKDVAFAQAYLEKVCEALQVVPGKVEDFLNVLYEFESNPDGRTAVELFVRLKPVLSDWPELLRDFAAFLHPEQAQECGLLEEQQAFERSRRFLRQLERTFGEHSMHYRRVVRTLQQGLPKSHRGSEEMKAQIALLFRDHTHLLEEYWVFYEQLHSTVQRGSDDEDEEEDEVDSMPTAQIVHSVEESQRLEKAENQTNQSHIQSTNVISPNTESCSAGTEMMDKQSREEDPQSHLKASQSPVCAKNSSRMPSGEKIVLWTREADRVILTTCQQRGACQSTFTSIAAQLGNKTPTEVGARYRDLIKLFHKSTKQHHSSFMDTEGQFHPTEEEPD
ncbi:GON-4-like protein isoform X1 [Pangasianodon hypophthalmus]|uniref:GON-4-like protein isoform X1 n=1 Tax=Pangasianodon hypophthalmus TaxID=310915 RepID=UPI0023074757|nr:GON-4-like protein isoform X1 [Pangasianodon hypophthalmus]